MATEFKPVENKAGIARSAVDHQNEFDTYLSGVLPAAQKSAEQWRSALLALVGLGAGIIFIRSPSGLDGLSTFWQFVIVSLTVVGVLFTSAALWAATTAASGLTQQISYSQILGKYGSIRGLEIFQAHQILAKLRLARLGSVLGLTALILGGVLAITVASRDDDASARLLVTDTASKQVCGEVVDADSTGSVALIQDGVLIEINLDVVASVVPAGSCEG